MIAYKVKDLTVIEVQCKSLSYPKKDSDSDTIYINTHFETYEEAYNQAIAECEAGIHLVASDIEHHQFAIQRLKDELAVFAIAQNNLNLNLQKRGSQNARLQKVEDY